MIERYRSILATFNLEQWNSNVGFSILMRMKRSMNARSIVAKVETACIENVAVTATKEEVRDRNQRNKVWTSIFTGTALLAPIMTLTSRSAFCYKLVL